MPHTELHKHTHTPKNSGNEREGRESTARARVEHNAGNRPENGAQAHSRQWKFTLYNFQAKEQKNPSMPWKD